MGVSLLPPKASARHVPLSRKPWLTVGLLELSVLRVGQLVGCSIRRKGAFAKRSLSGLATWPAARSGAVTRATVVRLWTKLGEISPKVWLDADLLGRSARRKVRYGLHEGVAVRSVSRVIPAVIAGAVGMGAGLGIGLVAASHGSTGTPRRPATTSVASSVQWAGGGAQLKRVTGRHWAYEPIPIDVKGNGTYVFDFGPVPASFDYPSKPSGIAFEWPPDGLQRGADH